MVTQTPKICHAFIFNMTIRSSTQLRLRIVLHKFGEHNKMNYHGLSTH